jgi:hypothetical protein
VSVTAKIHTAVTSPVEADLARQILNDGLMQRIHAATALAYDVEDHSTKLDAWTWQTFDYANDVTMDAHDVLTRSPARWAPDIIAVGLISAVGPVARIVECMSIAGIHASTAVGSAHRWLSPPAAQFALNRQAPGARIVRTRADLAFSGTAPTTFTLVSAEEPPLDRLFGRPQVDPLEGYEQYSEAAWDGHDAAPITADTLQYARKLLNVIPKTFGPPDIAPSADGSIGLEWVADSGPLRKLFLDIGPGTEWRAYWNRRSGEFGRLTGKSLSANTKRTLQKLFGELSI